MVEQIIEENYGIPSQNVFKTQLGNLLLEMPGYT